MPKELSERARVNDFVKGINFRCYTFIDQDTGTIRTKSGWDFLISANGKSIFIEAKLGMKKLKPYQELTQMEVLKSGGVYGVLRFDKKFRDGMKLFLSGELENVNPEGRSEIYWWLKFYLTAAPEKKELSKTNDVMQEQIDDLQHVADERKEHIDRLLKLLSVKKRKDYLEEYEV